MYKKKHYVLPDVVVQETITQVRFSNALSPPPISIIEAESIIEKIVEKKPEPIIKKKAKVKPKPIPKATPKAKPKPKKVKPKPTPKLKPKPKKVTPKPLKKIDRPIKKAAPIAPASVLKDRPAVVQSTKVVTAPSTAEQLLIEQTRKNYKARVIRHVDDHQHYSRVAKKRRIEGKILISFSLYADGSIKNLSIKGKKSILIKSTKKAINNALPMPNPPKRLSFPIEIKFYMNYFLK